MSALARGNCIHSAHTVAATTTTTAATTTATATTTVLAIITHRIAHTEIDGLCRVLDDVEEAALGDEALSLWVLCLSLKLSDPRTENSKLLAQNLLANRCR